MADLAEAMGLQKGSLYSLTESKQELLVVITRDGARRSTLRSTACRTASRSSGSVSRCARISAVVAGQVSAATVFTREWRFSTSRSGRPSGRSAGATRSAGASSCRTAAERGALRSDLDVEAAVLLVLSAANWAYTWIRPGADTDELADAFFATLLDGVRGYATRPS
jgi:AcrR family transcriptional regulator